MFWKRKQTPAPIPRVAACYVDPRASRAAAQWLTQLELCESIAILSDDPQEVLRLCLREKPDLLLLQAMPDAMEKLDDPDKDISGRCELSVRVKEGLPDCRVYLICAEQFRQLEPVTRKAVETQLIDGYRFGSLSRQLVETWLAERESGGQRDLPAPSGPETRKPQ